jgi:hypothetical protein
MRAEIHLSGRDTLMLNPRDAGLRASPFSVAASTPAKSAAMGLEFIEILRAPIYPKGVSKKIKSW